MTRSQAREMLGKQCEGIQEGASGLAINLRIHDDEPKDMDLHNALHCILHCILNCTVAALEDLAMLDLKPEKADRTEAPSGQNGRG